MSLNKRIFAGGIFSLSLCLFSSGSVTANGHSGHANENSIDHASASSHSNPHSSSQAGTVHSNNSGHGRDNNITVNDGETIEITSSPGKRQVIGINGGNGDDTIINNGGIIIDLSSVIETAPGNHSSSGNHSNEGHHNLPGLSENNHERNEHSQYYRPVAIGISGGAGNDVIVNNGTLTLSTAFSSNFIQDLLAGYLIGITGDAGNDNITNSGVLITTDISTFPIFARAQTKGIEGNNGQDVITNSGEITTLSDASSFVLSGGIAYAKSSADAVSIDGGDNSDTITNTVTGTITTSATATSTSQNVSASTLARGGALGVAVSSVSSEANATGIQGGDGNDSLINAGTLITSASATSTSQDSSLAINGVSAALNTFWKGGMTATANAVGMDGGNGDDTQILNQSSIETTAHAVTDSTVTAMVVTGIAAASATSTATSVATGIQGGDGGENSEADDFAITNEGDITVLADANAFSDQVAITGSGMAVAASKKGGLNIDTANDGTTTVTISRWNAGTTADAMAVGIDGGAGDDEVLNTGSIDVTARAITNVRSKVVNLSTPGSGGGSGLASRFLGNIFTDLSTNAIAHASGIQGGDGNDEIVNNGSIMVDAFSMPVASELDFSLSGTSLPGLGILKGLILGEGSANSTASAIGIDGGDGNDQLTNNNSITSRAVAVVPSLGVSLNVNNGPSVDLAAKADASAVGMNGDAGNDVINNNGVIVSIADASVLSLGVGVTGGGLVGFVNTDSNATASAAGINAGDGDDAINNSNGITATALANAVAGSVGINLQSGKEIGAYSRLQATASAVGIDADGNDATSTTTFAVNDVLVDAEVNSDNDTTTISLDYSNIDTENDTGSVRLAFEKNVTTDSGDDTINNQSVVNANAIATNASADVAVTVVGAAIADTSSLADAQAQAIRAGGGNDVINNTGDLIANSVSDAIALGVSVTPIGLTSTIGLGGVTATASSTGIQADSGTEASKSFSFELNSPAVNAANTINFTVENSLSTQSGDDSITNNGSVTATATATAASADIAAGYIGAMFTDATSFAQTKAVAIDAGGGDDVVTSNGPLTAVATSIAASANIPITVNTGAAIARGGSEASARAVGIDGDGDGDNVIEQTSIEVANDSVSFTNEMLVTNNSGDDTVTSHDAITAVATALAPELDAPVAINGVAIGLTGAKANAQSVAIDLGAGDDNLTNTGTLTSVATATAFAANIPVTAGTGAAISLGGPEATAKSVGIDADGDGYNYSKMINIDASLDGVSFLDETLVNNDRGNDVVTNNGVVTAVATAITPELDVPVAATGITLGMTESKASAQSAAIDLGAGDDNLTNTGTLTSVATATAFAANIPVTAGTGAAISLGGPEAVAKAVGIDADGDATNYSETTQLDASLGGVSFLDETLIYNESGNDVVTNDGVIDAIATALTFELDAPVSIQGVSVGITAAKSTAQTTAIDLGGGDDNLNNTGLLNSIATTSATAANLSVSAGSSIAIGRGGSESEAVAVGIDADGDGSNFTNRTSFDATLDHIAYQDIILVENDSGDDIVTNDGNVNAIATATAPVVGAAIGIAGLANSSLTSKARASATAIDLGGGDDTLTNTDHLNAISTATAVTLQLNATATSAAVSLGGSEAKATAVGIDADGDGDNFSKTISVDASLDGVSFLDETVIHNDSGEDSVINHAGINAVATALAASSTTSATSIDLGGDDDSLTNTGTLTSVATSTAVNADIKVAAGGTMGSVIAIGTSAVGLLSGGSVTEAKAVGIDADGDARNDSKRIAMDVTLERITYENETLIENNSGDDTVTNDGVITAVATTIMPELDAPIAMTGVTVGMTNSRANAQSVAIDLGGGDDTLNNTGTLTAISTAIALAANIPVSAGTGAAISLGGPEATAKAVGIDADGDGYNYSKITSVDATLEGTHFLDQTLINNDSGIDTITNDAAVTAVATALTPELDLPVTMAGVTFAETASKADAQTVAIDLGGDDDTLNNTGTLTAVSTATALAANIPVSGGTGVAMGLGGPEATAKAVGIDGDGDGYNFSHTISIDATLDGINFLDETLANNDSGQDTIVNDGVITAVATAITPEIDAPATMAGVTVGITAAKANAQSVAIDLGGDDDTLNNTATLTAVSTATAFAANIPVSAGTGVAIGLGGPEATAKAVGIDGDGDGYNYSKLISVDASLEGISFLDQTRIYNDSGSDTVTNDSAITAVATSITPELDVPVSVAGVTFAETASKADAQSVAVDLGGDDDSLNNTGTLTSVSTATAIAANIPVTAGSGAAISLGGPEATAKATGIDGDGDGYNFSHTTRIDASLDGVSFLDETLMNNDSGQDTIINDGVVTAVATAITPELDVPVAVTGVAFGTTAAKAVTHAAAIDLGGDDDNLTNTGSLNAIATSTAFAEDIAFTTAGLAMTFGGTTAEAKAVGIDADGDGSNYSKTISVDASLEGVSFLNETVVSNDSGNDTISNEGNIVAVATALSPTISGAVSVAGVSAAIASAKSTAEATAIDSGDGDDDITNSGTLTAVATSNADVINLSATPAGVALAANAIWDGGATADATAVGIDTDGSGSTSTDLTSMAIDSDGFNVLLSDIESSAGGDDTVNNSGDIYAVATAVVPSVAISFTGAGLAATVATSTASASTAAIITGGGDDEILNTGDLVSVATSNADTVNVAVTPAGVALASDAIWDGGTTAEASALGISTDGSAVDKSIETSIYAGTDGVEIQHSRTTDYAHGDDQVENHGDIHSVATAVSPSVGVSVAVAGVAGVVSTATADANASAIDTGAGNDEVINTGDLNVDSTSVAAAVSVSVTPAGLAVAAGDPVWDSVWESIENTDWDTVVDQVANGEWETVWDEIGGIVDEAVWDGGVSATSNAVGINTDSIRQKSAGVGLAINDDGVTFDYDYNIEQASGNDSVENEGDITVNATSVSPSLSVGVSVWGVGVATSTAEAEAATAGISTGGGEDEVNNSGDITTTSVATAETLNVSVSVGGVAVSSDAVWDSGTTAEAFSDGINTGSGDDEIENSGFVNTRSVAVAPSISIPVGIFGVAAALSDATANAYSTGIDACDGNDEIFNEGRIFSSAVANADAIGVAVNIFGVAGAANAVWDGGVTATTTAFGIDAGQGDDDITNTAIVDANSTAVSVAANIPFTVGGVAGAVSTSTARADATAINGGEGEDTINNSNALTADADSTAVTATGSIGVFGVAVASDAVWDGGTHSSAYAYGIDGGADNDTLTNSSSINARSIARANSDQISVTLIGVASSTATSTSVAESHAIAGGDGNDSINNTGEIIAIADARATSVAVDISGLGAAIASDAVWDGGTGATANATGISGGEGNDDIWNRGTIHVGLDEHKVSADTDSVSVAATIGILATAISASTATSTVNAIDGGNGNDNIFHFGDASVFNSADAGGVSVSVLGTGAAIADSFIDDATKADATGNGIAGGDGEDVIVTYEGATINVDSTAKTKATNVALAIAGGFSRADASSRAISHATGIAGGAGVDVIDHSGVQTATAHSESVARSVSFTGLGATVAEANSGAESYAYGIDGGDGDDAVTNRNSVSAIATAVATGQGIGISITGASFGDTSTTADVDMAGINGGLGNDSLVNFASIVADGSATANAKSTGFNAIGYSAANADTISNTWSAGMSGGADQDTLINADTGVIDVTANADANASSVSINLLGVSKAEVATTPTSTGIGMDGGTGDDEISNEGLLTVTSTANTVTTGTSFTIAGANVNRISTTTISNATGLAGGNGMDTLANSGALDVNATSTMRSSGSSWALVGKSVSEGSGSLGVTTHAYGVSGGNDADVLLNSGTVTVNGSTDIEVSSDSDAIFGGANASTTVNSDAFATGMDGGNGNDSLFNESTIDVTATAEMTSNQVAFTFIGGSSATATLTSNANAKGLVGGNGADIIHNEGDISATATSTLTATGGVDSKIGGASSDVTVDANAMTTGIDSGVGDDTVFNSGDMVVHATASPTVTTEAQSGILFSDGVSKSISKSTTLAYGMNLSGGNNSLLNEGNLDVVTSGIVRANAISSSDTLLNLGLNIDANATATALLNGTESIAILVGNGNNYIESSGDISVTSRQQAFANANANGGGIVDGDGTATATARANNAMAAGIQAGNGNNTIMHRGNIEVRVAPRVDAYSYSDADGLPGVNDNGATQPNSSAKSVVTANDVRAVGISAGDGNNWISNEGTLTVTAAPNANRANAYADYGADVLGIDSFATATATANNAAAFGILVGDGNNFISNSGNLIVASNPVAIATATARGIGFDGDAEARATAEVNNALAVGIKTGNGDNTIINDGVIDVSVAPTYQVTATATPGTGTISAVGTVVRERVCDGWSWLPFNGWLCRRFVDRVTEIVEEITDNGEVVEVATGTRDNARAIGIQTGDGNDIIINNGSIITAVNGIVGAGVGIASGAGNDTVVLGDGSLVDGSVELGADNDTLHLQGSPIVNGAIISGSGMDSLVFEGSGVFVNPLSGFVASTKIGAGTYTLPALSTMDRLEIREGTLQITDNYQMATDSLYQTYVYGDGSNGQFNVQGTVTLDGELLVTKGGSPFVDGTTYDVISANTISGTFNAQTLPAPTPLLSFSVEQLDTTVQVTANVESFTTTATTAGGLAVARQLDTLLTTTNDDLAAVLSTIQGLPENELGNAFASLNPVSYDSSLEMASTLKYFNHGAHNRLANIRSNKDYWRNYGKTIFLPGAEPLIFTSASSESNIVVSQQYGENAASRSMDNIWLAGFRHSSNQAGNNDAYNEAITNSGGTILGIDLPLNKHFVAGISFGSSFTDTTLDTMRSESAIESSLGSVYGTYMFNNSTYIESIFTFGQNAYGNMRTIDIGNIEDIAYSSHDSKMYSVSLEAGKAIAVGGWNMEFSSKVQHFTLKEEAFQEIGVGGINMKIDDRKFENLSLGLGWQAGYMQNISDGILQMQFSVDLIHDININDNSITASFVGVPDSQFILPGRKVSENGINLGSALTFDNGNDLSMLLRFNAELRDGYSDISTSVQANKKF